MRIWQIKNLAVPLSTGLGSALLGVCLIGLLVPPVSWANHTVSRVCMDALPPSIVSVNLHFRTGNATTGPLTVRNVLRSALVSDPEKCQAPSVGVVMGSLGLSDHAAYFVKAEAVDNVDHRSLLSAEASGTPIPFSASIPPAVAGFRVSP